MAVTVNMIRKLFGPEAALGLADDFTFTGVEFDTRKIQGGELFVPLQGQRDGHDFVSGARENGAAATFWARETILADDFPVVRVKDTLSAFQLLAKAYLLQQNPQVIGITGSNGKTTTKDFTAAVLSEKFKTYKTQGNYNNQIGLPYTILHMPKGTEMLVLEMGMDRPGDIAELAAIAEPDVAAITLIGESHLEHLGSRQAIAAAKMEIVAGLKEDGLLIVPAGEPLLEPFLKACLQQKVTFGLAGTGDVYAQKVVTTAEETTFSVNCFPEEVFTIPVMGAYNVKNALIAIITGKHYNMTAQEVRQGLGRAVLTQNRTQWLSGKNNITILSDVYNANPSAMQLVLDEVQNLAEYPRRCVVLGDMLELGQGSRAFHEELASHLDPYKIQKVFLYGSEMAFLRERLSGKYLPENLHYFPQEQKESLINVLKNTLQEGDLVVLKGSNGMGLGEVVTALE